MRERWRLTISRRKASRVPRAWREHIRIRSRSSRRSWCLASASSRACEGLLLAFDVTPDPLGFFAEMAVLGLAADELVYGDLAAPDDIPEGIRLRQAVMERFGLFAVGRELGVVG